MINTQQTVNNKLIGGNKNVQSNQNAGDWKRTNKSVWVDHEAALLPTPDTRTAGV